MCILEQVMIVFIEIILMDANQVEAAFMKVNRTLMAQLPESERREAIQEFQQLFAEQMGRVARQLDRRQKVQDNLSERQMQEESEAQLTQSGLQRRMQLHLRKREDYQRQKLKNYKEMELVWKDKMQQIAKINKNKLHEVLMESNRMQKETQQFWERKTAEQRKENSEKKHQQSRYKEQKQFITEIVQIPERKSRAKVKRDSELPILDKSKRLKTWGNASRQIDGEGSKDKSKDVDLDQAIRLHIQRSSQQSRAKEEQHFQNAMQKMDKILKARIRMKQKHEKDAKLAKQSRINRQGSIQNAPRYQSSKPLPPKRQPTSPQQTPKNHTLHVPNRQSQVEIRRRMVEQQRIKQRNQLFQSEKKRMRRGKFHLMVKQAVKMLKLQALQKSDMQN